MAFQECLAVILASEGGYTVDQGGPTNFGITQRALSSYLGHAATIGDVMNLTAESVAPIYLSDYWNPAHCGMYANGVNLMVFDEAVNEGVGRAICHLQTALGVTADGIVGSETLDAENRADPVTLINRLHDLNSAYYDSLATIYPQDQAGWHARNDRTRVAALKMVS